MILVTGATGNIGRHLVRDLAASGGAGPVRALSRDPARAAFPAGVEAVAGDLARAADGGLATALAGVRSLFLVAGLAPEEPVLAAARDAGVGHVVLVSSLTVETHPRLWPARANAAVEERVRDSGLAWTILRPTQFASNALWWADAIRAHGTVRAPYGDVGLPTVHPADIAAVARAALLDPAGHAGRTYPVTGPERVTPRQQTAALAAALGRDLAFHEESRAEAHARLAGLMGPGIADAILDVTGGDVNDAILAVHDTVPRLTGAPGRTFSQWAGENAAAFR